jgi:hypothetical protein
MLKILLNLPSIGLVDEIWVWEAVQHGDSALLNRDSLGTTCMCDWLWFGFFGKTNVR